MICVFCKHGQLAPGQATATFDRQGVVVIIQNVPADVCAQCGEPYYDGPTTDRLLDLVDRAMRAGVKIEIRDYAAA